MQWDNGVFTIILRIIVRNRYNPWHDDISSLKSSVFSNQNGRKMEKSMLKGSGGIVLTLSIEFCIVSPIYQYLVSNWAHCLHIVRLCVGCSICEAFRLNTCFLVQRQPKMTGLVGRQEVLPLASGANVFSDGSPGKRGYFKATVRPISRVPVAAEHDAMLSRAGRNCPGLSSVLLHIAVYIFSAQVLSAMELRKPGDFITRSLERHCDPIVTPAGSVRKAQRAYWSVGLTMT